VSYTFRHLSAADKYVRYLSMSKAQMNHDARNTVGVQNQFDKLDRTIRVSLSHDV